MQRVAVYIDGFNLYFGMRGKYGRRFLWLDPWALGESFLNDGQGLVRAAYFTARVRRDPPAQARQGLYLSALKAASRCEVIEGRFQEKHKECKNCGKQWISYEEKESDVSLAVALVEDAANDVYDRAIIVTGDSDIGPAVVTARRFRSGRRFLAAFPPERNSDDLKRHVDGSFKVGRDKLLGAQLPETVTDADSGKTFTRPTYWS